jgi:hypothetical protein
MMSPLLQLFKMESTSDSRYKQRAVIQFLVAVQEMVENIHKRPSSVCGNSAVGRSTVDRWAERVRVLEVGKAQLLDVLHQLAEW